MTEEIREMDKEYEKSRKITTCGRKTEVYSRVCGYFRPIENWNRGKKEEFKDRKAYNPAIKEKLLENDQKEKEGKGE